MLIFLFSGQFGKVWAPSLGVWGVGVGTAALFVRAHPGTFQSHIRAVFNVTLLGSGLRTAPFRNANREERSPG